MKFVVNPKTGKLDAFPSPSDLVPKVTEPITSTIFHNPSIPPEAGVLCIVVAFGVKAAFLGTYLDTTIDNNFWNWSKGFYLVRRSGVGPSNITLDAQTIGAKPAVRVKPGNNGIGSLVADFSGVGASHGYITTADGDRIPVYNEPAANIATFPQLRSGSGSNNTFQADFGADFVVPLAGSSNELKMFSRNGKVFTVIIGTSGQVLHIDGSHNLCQGSGADITKQTADLLNSISLIQQYRFPIYVKDSNPIADRLLHMSPFIPHDLYVALDDENHSLKITYDPDADDNALARWNASRVEANLAGAANITVQEGDRRPDQIILIV